jgi:hypothetical protein
MDPTRSFDEGRRAQESEQHAMRRLHREQVSSERARRAEQQPASPPPVRFLPGPAAGILAILRLRGARR